MSQFGWFSACSTVAGGLADLLGGPGAKWPTRRRQNQTRHVPDPLAAERLEDRTVLTIDG